MDSVAKGQDHFIAHGKPILKNVYWNRNKDDPRWVKNVMPREQWLLFGPFNSPKPHARWNSRYKKLLGAQ